MSRWIGLPYRDENDAIQFPGAIWFFLLFVPWLIGLYTIVGWI